MWTWWRKLSTGTRSRSKRAELNKGDCVCSNEQTFYPPLTQVENSAPAYTVDAEFRGRGFGPPMVKPADAWRVPGNVLSRASKSRCVVLSRPFAARGEGVLFEPCGHCIGTYRQFI